MVQKSTETNKSNSNKNECLALVIPYSHGRRPGLGWTKSRCAEIFTPFFDPKILMTFFSHFIVWNVLHLKCIAKIAKTPECKCTQHVSSVCITCFPNIPLHLKLWGDRPPSPPISLPPCLLCFYIHCSVSHSLLCFQIPCSVSKPLYRALCYVNLSV